jgi:hypothetical protein
VVDGYGDPAVPPGSEEVVTAREAGLILMLRVELAACGEGLLESVTLIVADAVPTELCAGVPLIMPVVLLMVSPLGKLPVL